MHKEQELKSTKRTALLLLFASFTMFVATMAMPQGLCTGLVRAISEAAMVGALADWFAVVALFRRIPIPYVSRHTAIIPKNKDKIADNLAVFVQEKFLGVDAMVALIRKHDPAQRLSDWFLRRENAERLGTYLVSIAKGMLGFIEDGPVQKFIKDAVHDMLAKVDLSKSAGTILEGLTKDRRHQALLDQAIAKFAGMLRNEETRKYIARGIVRWLKDEYPITEKVLPSETIGKYGAEMAVTAAGKLLSDVNDNPEHELRQKFDAYAKDFIERLKTDPEFAKKGEEIKHYLQNDETFNAYLKELWGSLRDWLKRDLDSDDSAVRRNVIASGQWLGKALAEDAQLRATLNEHMAEAARHMAPDFAQFLTGHIRDTVRNWDSREMSQQIELNIGKDLQFIRINGTIVGGLIGALLYGLSLLPVAFAAL